MDFDVTEIYHILTNRNQYFCKKMPDNLLIHLNIK